MKKLLLSLFLLVGTFGFSQDYPYYEECTTMTIGNIGTSLTGASAGQGGWYTTVPTAASPAGQNSDFQVVDGGAENGNCIQITGTSSATGAGQTRSMYRNFGTDWTNRTSGNDVVHLEYDFYTGASSTSKNTYRNYIFNAANTIAMAGFYFVPETMEIKGWAQYNNAGTIGYYTFGLGPDTANPSIFLDPDTWYRIGVAYNYTTGQIVWKEATGLFYGGVTGANVAVDINRIQYQISNADTNDSAAVIKIDNIGLSFRPTQSLLGTDASNLDIKFLRVSPNPAKDIVTISNPATLFNNVEVIDINGRVVKSVTPNAIDTAQINISDLSSGVYLLKIVSDKGTVTKKIVKE
jgi:hypothetical protein